MFARLLLKSHVERVFCHSKHATHTPLLHALKSAFSDAGTPVARVPRTCSKGGPSKPSLPRRPAKTTRPPGCTDEGLEKGPKDSRTHLPAWRQRSQRRFVRPLGRSGGSRGVGGGFFCAKPPGRSGLRFLLRLDGGSSLPTILREGN